MDFTTEIPSLDLQKKSNDATKSPILRIERDLWLCNVVILCYQELSITDPQAY